MSLSFLFLIIRLRLNLSIKTFPLNKFSFLPNYPVVSNIFFCFLRNFTKLAYSLSGCKCQILFLNFQLFLNLFSKLFVSVSFTCLSFYRTSHLKRLQISNFIFKAPTIFESFFKLFIRVFLFLFSIFNASRLKRLQMSNFIFKAPTVFESFFKTFCSSFSFPVFNLQHLSFEAVAKVRSLFLSPNFFAFFYPLIPFLFCPFYAIYSITSF